MTVQELIEELKKWRPDATVVKSDDLDNFHDIGSVDQSTAYDQYFVVID